MQAFFSADSSLAGTLPQRQPRLLLAMTYFLAAVRSPTALRALICQLTALVPAGSQRAASFIDTQSRGYYDAWVSRTLWQLADAARRLFQIKSFCHRCVSHEDMTHNSCTSISYTLWIPLVCGCMFFLVMRLWPCWIRTSLKSNRNGLIWFSAHTWVELVMCGKSCM